MSKPTTIKFEPPARDDFLEDIARGVIRKGSHYISEDGTVYTIKQLRADGAMTLEREYPRERGKAARKAEKRARHAAGARADTRTAMKLPPSVRQIRDLYVQQFGVPAGSPESIDAIARDWSIRFAQQLAASFPGQGYGMKRADPNRPISKDTIAQNLNGLRCWDLLTGTGTGQPSLNQDPDALEIPDQVFVPVEPKDWLKLADTKPTDPTPQPIPPGGTDAAVLAALTRLEQKFDGIVGLTSHLEELVKGADDNNERRYADLVANVKAMPASRGYRGTVSILGMRVTIELDPK